MEYAREEVQLGAGAEEVTPQCHKTPLVYSVKVLWVLFFLYFLHVGNSNIFSTDV